jgi:hypothetical protein
MLEQSDTHGRQKHGFNGSVAEWMPTVLVPFVLASTLIILIWKLAPWVMGQVDSETVAKLGQVGDYMGGVLNPIVSMFALAALWSSLHVQRKELRETRDELHQTRKNAERQQVDQVFFEVARLLRDAIAACQDTDRQHTEGPKTIFGNEVFRKIAQDCVNLVTNPHDQRSPEERYRSFQKLHERHLGQPLRLAELALALTVERRPHTTEIVADDESSTNNLYRNVLRGVASKDFYLLLGIHALWGNQQSSVRVVGKKIGLFDDMFEDISPRPPLSENFERQLKTLYSTYSER